MILFRVRIFLTCNRAIGPLYSNHRQGDGIAQTYQATDPSGGGRQTRKARRDRQEPEDLGETETKETTMKHLLKVMTHVETRYGEVEDNSLGRLYEEGLDALRTDDERRQLLAAEGLAEWVKHHENGHYA